MSVDITAAGQDWSLPIRVVSLWVYLCYNRLKDGALVDGPFTHNGNQNTMGATGRIGSSLIKPNDNAANGEIRCRSRLGGLLNFYYREAA